MHAEIDRQPARVVRNRDHVLDTLRPTDEFIAAMGFDPSIPFREQTRALRKSLKEELALSPADWTRAVLATEIAFVSDAVGSGVEWATTTGRTDAETIVLLRSIQRKLVAVIHTTMGSEIGIRGSTA